MSSPLSFSPSLPFLKSMGWVVVQRSLQIKVTLGSTFDHLQGLILPLFFYVNSCILILVEYTSLGFPLSPPSRKTYRDKEYSDIARG